MHFKNDALKLQVLKTNSTESTNADMGKILASASQIRKGPHTQDIQMHCNYFMISKFNGIANLKVNIIHHL